MTLENNQPPLSFDMTEGSGWNGVINKEIIKSIDEPGLDSEPKDRKEY